VYFSEDFTSAKEKQAYDLLKRKIILTLNSVQYDVDNAKEIEQIEKSMFSRYKPRIFIGKDSVEIAQDRQFEDMCLIIAQKLNMQAKVMTVLEFYNAINLIKKQADAEAKALKVNKKK
jgi:hypothetical protein